MDQSAFRDATAAAARAVRLPDVFDLGQFVDLGLFKTRSGARRAALAGSLGPFGLIGRRFVFRRESFLSALGEREVQSPQVGNGPGPDPGVRKLLLRRIRGGGGKQ